jgi:hypothetical protein
MKNRNIVLGWMLKGHRLEILIENDWRPFQSFYFPAWIESLTEDAAYRADEREVRLHEKP